jgi:hypothetical protein
MNFQSFVFFCQAKWLAECKRVLKPGSEGNYCVCVCVCVCVRVCVCVVCVCYIYMYVHKHIYVYIQERLLYF